jgi:hypothetical protein
LPGGGDAVAFFGRKLRDRSRPGAGGKRRYENRGEGGGGKRDCFAVELHDLLLWEDGARPIIYHTRAATCMQPQVKGLTVMVNSQFNGWRMEDVRLDR